MVLGIPRTDAPLPSHLMLVPESSGICLLPHSRSACFISGGIKVHSFLTRLLLPPSWYTWPNLLPAFMSGGYQRFSASGSSPGPSTPTTPPLCLPASPPLILFSTLPSCLHSTTPHFLPLDKLHSSLHDLCKPQWIMAVFPHQSVSHTRLFQLPPGSFAEYMI